VSLTQLDHSRTRRRVAGRRLAVHDAPRMRLLIASDSLLIREGLRRLLDEQQFEVVGQAVDSVDLLRKVGAHHPEVAILHFQEGGREGDEPVRAAREIRVRWPRTGVLVLSQHVDRTLAADLLADGTEGIGYLLPQRVQDLDGFRASIRRVGDGGSAMDPAVVSLLLRKDTRDSALDRLTPREVEVLRLIAEGRSNHGIGAQLFLTSRGVEKHTANIYSKLDIPAGVVDHRRVHAAIAYLRNARATTRLLATDAPAPTE
jgi:DNA-binding NarL/FixJ family response regulator